MDVMMLRQPLPARDVAGQRLVIDAPQFPDQTPETTTEVQGILDSIHLAPPTPAPIATAAPTP